MYCYTLSKLPFDKISLKFIRHFNDLSYLHNACSDPLKPLTFGKLLEQTAKKYGDREAIVSLYQNKRATYNQVLEQADRLAAGLRSIGLQNGDRIGIWGPNSLEWYICKMATARAGLNVVTLNPAYQPREIEYCINTVGLKAMICSHKFIHQDYYEILNSIAPELAQSEPGKLKSKRIPSLESIIITSDDDLKGTFNYSELINNATESSIENIKKHQNYIKIDDPFNVQFTSGSTGNPKAAVVSHFQLVNNGYFVGKRNGLDQKHHKICVQVPFFHAFGTSITISASLNHGGTLVVPAECYSPDKNLDAIVKEKCSIIHGTPTMYVDLVNVQKRRKEDISPEIAVTGGATCSPHLFREMYNTLHVKTVKSVYGLSETTAVVFQSMPGDDEYKSTSTVGYVSEHTEVKIVDNQGCIVPRGTPGELCIRAYSNMLGYYNNEEKTKETIGVDGWLKTGDQFVLEHDGYGRIVGRLKDLIIRGGENIYPKEIEDVLNAHPSILESHVIGIPHERLGEVVCACVRVQDGSNLSLESIKDFCKSQISHFKIPTVLRIVESFPKTTSGKIQKFKLVQQHTKEMRKTTTA